MSIITQSDDSRVMIFIDARNLINGVKTECSFDAFLDWSSLPQMLAGKRKIVGGYVFDGEPRGENIEQQMKFHHCLEHLGYRVITRDALDVENRVQKEVDVALACEMLDHAIKDHYDVAILVSGDRDFVPAVEFVQRYGKTVEVACFKKSGSYGLIKSADSWHNLCEFPIIRVRIPEKKEEPEEIREAPAEIPSEEVAEAA